MRVEVQIDGLPNRWSGSMTVVVAGMPHTVRVDGVSNDVMAGAVKALLGQVEETVLGKGAQPNWQAHADEERSAAEMLVEVLHEDDDELVDG